MPRTVIDYNNTIIYKIQHLENPELICIEHTTNFDKRKSVHKKNSRISSAYLYCTIRENGKWEMFNMIQIKEFPCFNAREADNGEIATMGRSILRN